MIFQNERVIVSGLQPFEGLLPVVDGIDRIVVPLQQRRERAGERPLVLRQ